MNRAEIPLQESVLLADSHCLILQTLLCCHLLGPAPHACLRHRLFVLIARTCLSLC